MSTPPLRDISVFANYKLWIHYMIKLCWMLITKISEVYLSAVVHILFHEDFSSIIRINTQCWLLESSLRKTNTCENTSVFFHNFAHHQIRHEACAHRQVVWWPLMAIFYLFSFFSPCSLTYVHTFTRRVIFLLDNEHTYCWIIHGKGKRSGAKFKFIDLWLKQHNTWFVKYTCTV